MPIDHYHLVVAIAKYCAIASIAHLDRSFDRVDQCGEPNNANLHLGEN